MMEPFAIKIAIGDGLYSAGKDTVKPSRHGKAWTSRGALKNHLRMVAKERVPGGLYSACYGDACGVVEILEGGLLSWYPLSKWVKDYMEAEK